MIVIDLRYAMGASMHSTLLGCHRLLPSPLHLIITHVQCLRSPRPLYRDWCLCLRRAP